MGSEMGDHLKLAVVSCLLASCLPWAASAVTVSNVRATQRVGTQLVDIRYDLVTTGSLYTVAVAVSTNNGALYDLSAPSMSNGGSVNSIGAGVAPGKNKWIVWNAGTDWGGQYSDQVRFQIAASAAAATAPPGMVLIPQGVNEGLNLLATGESNSPSYYPSAYSLTVGAFFMDQAEVTKAKWDEVRIWGQSHGYTDLATGAGKATNQPVQQVSWYDCAKWCNARSEMEQRVPAYYTTSNKATVFRTAQTSVEDYCVNWGGGYRLPTETEWEYAARGGVSSTLFPWDRNSIIHSNANYYSATNGPSYDKSPTRGYYPSFNDGVLPYTSPAGSFAPNRFGLWDLAGNVCEWCWNWYPGYEGIGRVVRGGGFGSGAADCRVGLRSLGPPIDSRSNSSVGFRATLPTTQQEESLTVSIGPTGRTQRVNWNNYCGAAISGGVSPYSYVWTSAGQNDGTYTSSNAAFNRIFGTVGVKWVKVMVTDSRGAVAASKTNFFSIVFTGGGTGEL